MTQVRREKEAKKTEERIVKLKAEGKTEEAAKLEKSRDDHAFEVRKLEEMKKKFKEDKKAAKFGE